MGLFELFAGVLAGFYALIPSYGASIILLTIAVRSLLLPLSIKQTRSMREMQRIQPEIKKLQVKHKGDRAKLNEEMMKLYKEHGVNPLGGCLPLLLQMPVFFALFYVIRTPLEYLGYNEPPGTAKDLIVPPMEYVAEKVSGLMETLQQSRLAQDLTHSWLETNSFLGIRLDCKTTDAMSAKDASGVGAICGTGLVSALPYIFLILAMGFTLFYQQRQMQANSAATGPQAQQMQLLGKIMPVMFMFFGINFPAGLLIYWVTTNAWTIGQQYLMLHVAPPHPAELSGPAPTSSPPKKSGKPDPGKPPARSDAKAAQPPLTKRSPSARKKKK